MQQAQGYRWVVAFVALALVAAACGGGSDTTPLSLEGYVEAMQAVEVRFAADTPNPAEETADRDGYPIGGDLVAANDLYMEFEARLDGWRAVTPPESLKPLHEELVGALDAVQAAVGKYLGDEAISNTDFDFASIGSKVSPLLTAAGAACRELRTAARDAGADLEFTGDCEF